ncbi:LRR receptor-like serine threonine-protein kinase [Musa troglodytarum]|uniref:LRR receptor-like serine threonine-protein kinase n=1 Tax=Musa troglodytarum TaxID=320322 RepID=A0A9E7HA29_9LILI|nr:LRR receptor-like serine threonine-protein kinase [Musa troglodytarum]
MWSWTRGQSSSLVLGYVYRNNQCCPDIEEQEVVINCSTHQCQRLELTNIKKFNVVQQKHLVLQPPSKQKCEYTTGFHLGHDGLLIHVHEVPWSDGAVIDLITITEEAIADGVASIQAVEDLIERLQPAAELHHPSPQDRVLSLHGKKVLCGETQGCQDLAVLLPQLAYLCREIIQMLLLAHP